MKQTHFILLLGLPAATAAAIQEWSAPCFEFECHESFANIAKSTLGACGLAFVGSRVLDDSRSDTAKMVKWLSDQAPTVVVVDYDEIALAIEAIKAGARDYLLCPLQRTALVDVVDRLYRPASVGSSPVYKSANMHAVFEFARKVAASGASVLVSGESGTGKEVLARFIHQQSPRHDKPFVAINCAAIPETMLESILFGYEKGAFTGAAAARAGKFEQANGGTLLLDEISEMDIGLQAKILRVLQEREIERLGGSRNIALDVRIIATTNRDLKLEVQAGRFREDLFYRLNVFPLILPALRDRVDDIAPLAALFLQKYADGARLQFSVAALALLQSHHWPGNVRELENTVQRAVIMADGPMITESQVMLDYSGHSATPAATSPAIAPVQQNSRALVEEGQSGLEGNLKNHEKDMILDALSNHHTKQDAARTLGISSRTLRYKLAKFRKEGILQST